MHGRGIARGRDEERQLSNTGIRLARAGCWGCTTQEVGRALAHERPTT